MNEQEIAAAYPVMLGVARRKLRNRADAEDAVQSALLMAWRYRETFEERCTLKTWLCTIVENKCGDRLRSWQRHPHVHLNLDWIQKEEPTTEDQLIERQITELAWIETSRLPAVIRLPLMISLTEDRQLKQAAADQRIAHSNLKGRAFRARKFLQLRMQKYL